MSSNKKTSNKKRKNITKRKSKGKGSNNSKYFLLPFLKNINLRYVFLIAIALAIAGVFLVDFYGTQFYHFENSEDHESYSGSEQYHPPSSSAPLMIDLNNITVPGFEFFVFMLSMTFLLSIKLSRKDDGLGKRDREDDTDMVE